MNAKEANLRRDRIYQEVIRLLREEREAARMSMGEVAWRSGLSQPMVSYVERGTRMPTLDTLLRMADALDLSLPKLLRKAETAARFPPASIKKPDETLAGRPLTPPRVE